MIRTFLHILFYLIISFKAIAQTGISIGPPRVYYFIGPGQSQTEKVLVSNPSKDFTLELGISLNDWQYSEYGDNQIHEAGTLSTSAAKWIHVPTAFFSLAPGESKELDVIMSIPADKNHNDEPVHTAMLYVTQLNPRDGVNEEGANIRIAVRTGIKLYQRKMGSHSSNIEITDFKFVDIDGNKSINLFFENTGNTWADGRIQMELFNQQTGEKTMLIDANLYTMPKDKRQQPIVLPSDLPPGNYIATALIDYGDHQTIKMAELEFRHD